MVLAANGKYAGSPARGGALPRIGSFAVPTDGIDGGALLVLETSPLSADVDATEDSQTLLRCEDADLRTANGLVETNQSTPRAGLGEGSDDAAASVKGR